MAPTNQQLKSSRAKLLAGGSSKKVVAPKARVQRYLKKTTEPQLREHVKPCLLLQGIKCPMPLRQVLCDIHKLLSPHAKLLGKSNSIVPFDTQGQQSLEFLLTKNDCSMFVMACSNKKRPNHLIIGRTFDRQLLDMMELAVLRFKSLQDYGGTIPKKRLGSKPLLFFCGDVWQHDPTMRTCQNILIDLYRGQVVDQLALNGIDHLIVFTAATPPSPVLGTNVNGDQPTTTMATTTTATPLIHQRTYFVKLVKNTTTTTGSSAPSVIPTLIPCGPDLDLQVRRTQWPSPDLWKASLRQPSALRPKKKKNQSTNVFGERLGRLHLIKQDVTKMGGRKAKALRRAEKVAAQEEQEALQKELDLERKSMGQEFEQTFGFNNEND